MKLIIMRGLPGSGKSTAAKKLADEKGYVHCEEDMYFEAQGICNNGDLDYDIDATIFCLDKCHKALKANKDVVVANVFPTIDTMFRYLELGKLMKADIRIVTMTGNYGCVHGTCCSIIEELKSMWQETPKGYLTSID